MLLNQTLNLYSIIRNWIATNSDLLTAVATIAIAFFTFTLWWATSKMMKVAQEQSRDMKTSIDIAKKAADAAKQSADALPAIERAYVFVKARLNPSNKDSVDIIGFGQNQATELIPIELIATNHGKTPAILMNIHRFADVFDDIEIDDLLLKVTHKSTVAIVLGAELIDSGVERIFNVTFFMNDEKRQRIANLAYRIVCFGRIQYEDVFGGSHDTVFCWQYQDLIENFYPGNKDHKRNYRT